MEEYIAFDSHKQYTLAEREDVKTGRARQCRIEHHHASIARIDHVTVADGDAARAPLHLYAVALGEPLLPAEGAVLNDAIVTADHVDTGAAPSRDGAIENAEVVDSGELDAVTIAGGA